MAEFVIMCAETVLQAAAPSKAALLLDLETIYHRYADTDTSDVKTKCCKA